MQTSRFGWKNPDNEEKSDRRYVGKSDKRIKCLRQNRMEESSVRGRIGWKNQVLESELDGRIKCWRQIRMEESSDGGKIGWKNQVLEAK